jgi:hypothetical protein
LRDCQFFKEEREMKDEYINQASDDVEENLPFEVVNALETICRNGFTDCFWCQVEDFFTANKLATN